jgi:gamma-glutamylaminecyclotransferase
MLDVPGQGFKVRGQVFEVETEALKTMDALERVGQPGGYTRSEITVCKFSELPMQSVRCFAYLKPNNQFGQESNFSGPYSEYTMVHALTYQRRAA